MKVVRFNSATRDAGNRATAVRQNWTSSARIARKTIRSLKDKPRPGPGLRADGRKARGWNWLRTKNHNSDFSTHTRPGPTIPRWKDLIEDGREVSVMRRGGDFAWVCARWLMILSTYSVRRREQSIDPLPVRLGRYRQDFGKYFTGINDSDYRDTRGEHVCRYTPISRNWL